jgi:UDP-glucuronate decarboxylase
MNSHYASPVNIGNTEELTIQKFAEKIRDMCGNNNKIVNLEAVVDDPRQRRPNIDVAFRELGWKPKVFFIEFAKNFQTNTYLS